MPEITTHEWFLRNLPADLMNENAMNQTVDDRPIQSDDEIMQILAEATIPAAGSTTLSQYWNGSMGMDMSEDEDDFSDAELDFESSGEIIYAM